VSAKGSGDNEWHRHGVSSFLAAWSGVSSFLITWWYHALGGSIGFVMRLRRGEDSFQTPRFYQFSRTFAQVLWANQSSRHMDHNIFFCNSSVSQIPRSCDSKQGRIMIFELEVLLLSWFSHAWAAVMKEALPTASKLQRNRWWVQVPTKYSTRDSLSISAKIMVLLVSDHC